MKNSRTVAKARILQRNCSQSEGVVVIAEGAAQKQIEAEINDAVVALFSVPSHKIKVMKMKK